MLKYYLNRERGTGNRGQANKIVNRLRRFIIIVFIFYLKRKAMRLHRKYNCQMFVVKFRGEILIISKKQFKQMRQHKLFPKTFTAENLKKIALFYTPYKVQTTDRQARINNDKKRV
jgi:hypothetical protein